MDTATIAPPLVWVNVQIGGWLACGLVSDGTVRCWGAGAYTAGAPGRDEVFTSVEVGAYGGCAVRPAGELACWCGNEDYSRLCTDVPRGQFQRISEGGSVACAEDLSGLLTCWGDLDYFSGFGQVPSEPVIDFEVEENYAAALLQDGSLVTWGFDKLPWGGEEPPPGVAFTQIALGRRHACGLDAAGTAWCWGEDTANHPFPHAPAGPWAQLVGYNEADCAIDAAGGVDCFWGIDLVALEIWDQQMPAVQWAQIGLGEWDGCGVDATGHAWCWGGDPAEEPWLDVPRLGP